MMPPLTGLGIGRIVIFYIYAAPTALLAEILRLRNVQTPGSGCNPESTAEALKPGERRSDISIGTGSKIDDKSQRDFASKPRVARNELPKMEREFQRQRRCLEFGHFGAAKFLLKAP